MANEIVTKLKAELQKQRADTKEARERAGKALLNQLVAEERLELVKVQLARCICGAKLPK